MSRTTSRITSAASDNATLITAGDTRYIGFGIINSSTFERYVKLYDKSTAPNATDTPFLTITIPANSQRVSKIEGGAGIRLNRGLGVRITAGLADNDGTPVGAGDVLAQVLWERA